LIKNTKNLKTFNIRLPAEKHKELKKISFETQKSLAEIFRGSVDKFIKEYKKRRMPI
jgi:predicted DNA-binding protein